MAKWLLLASAALNALMCGVSLVAWAVGGEPPRYDWSDEAASSWVAALLFVMLAEDLK